MFVYVCPKMYIEKMGTNSEPQKLDRVEDRSYRYQFMCWGFEIGTSEDWQRRQFGSLYRRLLQRREKSEFWIRRNLKIPLFRGVA